MAVVTKNRVVSFSNLGGCALGLVSHNKRQQSDFVKLSPFVQKHAQKSPSRPNRCGGRFVGLQSSANRFCGITMFSV